MKTAVYKRKGVVKLSIPAKVAYNSELFKESIYNLLDEIGCKACFSGVDCYISTFRDYILEAKSLKVASLDKLSDGTPQPVLLKPNNTLSASLSPEVAGNIKSVDRAINTIFDEIGCRACCSGHDVYFQNNFDFHFMN